MSATDDAVPAGRDGRGRSAAGVCYARRRSAGLCGGCGLPPAAGAVCDSCREKRRRAQQRWYWRHRPRDRARKVHAEVFVPTDPTELAYAAGAIDCGGCITIIRTRGYFSLCLIVAMANFAVIRRLAAAFGGQLNERRANVRAGHLPQLAWSVSGGSAARVLRAVLPHLTGKREQAELAVAYDDVASRLPRAGAGRRHTDETRRYAQWAFERMRDLKKGGGR